MKFRWKTALKIGGCILLLYICIHYWANIAGLVKALFKGLAPLFIGGLIAYLVNIPMSFFERHFFPRSKAKYMAILRRIVCMFLAIIVIVGVFAVVFLLVVPEFISCMELLVTKLPSSLSRAVDFLNAQHLLPGELASDLTQIDWKTTVNAILEQVSQGAIGDVLGTVVGIVTTVFSGVFTALLSIIFALYILVGKERIGSQFRRLYERYLKPGRQAKILNVLRTMDDCFHRFIIGQCLDAALLGVLCTIGMLIFGMPYASMVGALIAVTALIPIVGAWLGAIVGAFMILTISPIQALLFLVFLIILQQLEGNLIYPRIVGDAIGLPGIWVLAAVTVGGAVMGPGGMLIGVPLAATVYRLLGKDVRKGRKDVKKVEEQTASPEEQSPEEPPEQTE